MPGPRALPVSQPPDVAAGENLHVSDEGDWCKGELESYAPITHYATDPPLALPRPVRRIRCSECGTVLFEDGGGWRYQ